MSELVTTAAEEFTSEAELSSQHTSLVRDALQLWFGAWFQALGLYLTALFTYRKRELWPWGWKLFQPALLVASWAFFWGPLPSLESLLPLQYGYAARFTWLALATVISERLSQKLDYPLGRLPSLVIFALLPFALLTSLEQGSHPLQLPDALAWPFLWAAVAHALWYLVLPQIARFGWLLGVSAWWLSAFVSVELAGLTSSLPPDSGWNPAAWLIGPTVVVFALTRIAPRCFEWALRVFPLAPAERPLLLSALLRLSTAPLALLLLLLVFVQSFSVSGESAPVPYLPLLNPTDLSHVLALAAVWLWTRQNAETTAAATSTQRWSRFLRQIRFAGFAAAFVGFTALLGRAVHQYTGVEYDPDELFHSEAFQVAVSVAWTLLALSLMWFSSRTKLRSGWSVGAVLLSVTICKLFFVDLGRLGTGAKIITFLGVGALMLLIAFVAPLPPPKSNPEPQP
jgi:uncharacterized membrane protein